MNDLSMNHREGFRGCKKSEFDSFIGLEQSRSFTPDFLPALTLVDFQKKQAKNRG